LKRIFPIILAAAGTFLPVAVSAQTNAEQVMAIGRNVLSMEDYMLAIQYFNQAIKAKPYLADPYFFRAIAKLSLDDFKGAEEDCTLALERNKFKSEAYKVRGFARQSLGLDSLAVVDYNLGLEYNPQDKYFLYYKAVAETDLMRYDSSDSTFSTLLRLYPGFADGFTARGRLNTLRGDTVAALADVDKAISISRNIVNAYLMRAELNSKTGKWEAAVTDMDEAIRLEPQEPDLYVNRAYLRYNLDDFFGAMSDYNYALQLQPAHIAALFNRALLRYEVRDYDRAVDDFTGVLKLDPSNFHAVFNRGLIYLEQEKYRKALVDLQTIAERYPRFYQVYYAISEARRGIGDMRGATEAFYRGDDLVRRYVKNPDGNPLDRPTIAAADNSSGTKTRDNESEEQVMERFNQLVTVSETADTHLSYNERIKGRVQDRNVQVEPEPVYALSFNDSPSQLRPGSNYFRELDELNQGRYLDRSIYLVAGAPPVGDEKDMKSLFETSTRMEQEIESGKGRPVDRLALGIVLVMLKNFDGALVHLDKAVESDVASTVALMARGYARYAHAMSALRNPRYAEGKDEAAMSGRMAMHELSEAIADYDAALTLNPRLVFAMFNKGNIYYSQQDYTSAIQCYSNAVDAKPDFGQAYFNRGLAYLNTGQKSLAFADLSKAGELGVIPSYNLLKRMK